MSDVRDSRPGMRRATPRVRCRRVTASLIGLCIAGPLAAQGTESGATARAADARAAAIRDRFVRAVDHANRLKSTIDSSVRALSVAPAPDSVVAGAIVIRFRGEPPLPGFRQALVAGAAVAWTTASATMGAESALAAGHPLNAVRSRRTIWDDEPFAILNFPGKNTRFHQFRETPRPEALTAAILDLYGSLAGEREPIPLKQWTGTEWIPLAPNRREEWEEAGIALATSRSSYGRRCYEGAIGDCATALELADDPPADLLRRWYRTEDIPELVSEYSTQDSAERHLFRQCVRERHPDVCDAAARYRGVRYPLGVSIKHSLVAFALERGGPGAFTRLMNTAGTASHIIATTAGIPLDQLLTEWRVKTVAATPPSSMPGPLEGGTALAWAVALAALATRRRP